MRRILLSLLLCSAALHAESEKPRKISLNLCCLRHAGEVRTLLLKGDSNSPPAEVSIYEGGFTEAVPALVEDNRIVVYKKGPDARQAWLPDWSFEVPSSGKNVSAILLPKPATKESPAPYKALLLPAPRDFDYGSLLAFNLTPLNVRLDLGTKKISLQPGKSGSASLESEADAFNMVPVTAWIQNKGKWVTLHTTRWSYNERYRQVSLIWMDATTKRPEITSIRDVRPIPITD